MGADRRIGRIAEAQHGLVALVQAKESGLSSEALRHRRESGRLVPVQPRVYRFAGAPVTWAQRLAAACLAGGPGTCASHRAAAQLWHLLGEQSEVVEVTVPRRRRPRMAGVVLHRSSDLVPEHVTVRGGIPATNPLRTLVDLGAVLPARAVEEALERGLTDRLFTVSAAEWMLLEVGRRGRAGAGVLRRILDQRALGAHVPDGLLEPRMARLLVEHALPRAAFQHRVRSSTGRFIARVDFAYPERRLAIEVDGHAHHSTPEQLQRDLARQNALVAVGWTVLRFTWGDVVRAPAGVARQIRTVLGT